MGLNGTFTVAESAHCGERGRRVNKACLTYYLGDTVCTVGFEIIRLRWLHHVELGHTWTLHSSCGPVGALSLRSSSRFILDWFVFCYLVHRTGSA